MHQPALVCRAAYGPNHDQNGQIPDRRFHRVLQATGCSVPRISEPWPVDVSACVVYPRQIPSPHHARQNDGKQMA
jgi:hypothetical protein